MMEGTMAQTTHKRDEDGRMVQVVTPWELRRVLDEEGSCYSRPGDFGLEDEWRVGGVEDEPAAEPEVEPIEIADCGYDCGAGDTQWRYGLYLDPEARRIGHWEMYGSGTPERVWHGRAVIADLPFGAVGESVEEIVRSDELRDLVAALFALYEGSEWNGSNHIGRWQRDDDEYCDAKHERRRHGERRTHQRRPHRPARHGVDAGGAAGAVPGAVQLQRLRWLRRAGHDDGRRGQRCL
jgi:hypothetical protein